MRLFVKFLSKSPYKRYPLSPTSASCLSFRTPTNNQYIYKECASPTLFSSPLSSWSPKLVLALSPMAYAKLVRSNGYNRLTLAIILKVYACRMQHNGCGLFCCHRRIDFRARRRRNSHTRRYPCMQLGSRNLLGDLRDAGFARSHSMIKFVSHPSLFSYFQFYCYCCSEFSERT